MAPGHIPGSRNLPQVLLFNPDNSFKQGEALRAAFAEAGVDLASPMVTTCGSGVTAAVVLFGARMAHGFLGSGVLNGIPSGAPTDNVAFVDAHGSTIVALLKEIGVLKD